MNPPHGLTLIELLIVVAISGLLLGLGMPALSSSVEAARASDARAALLTSLVSASNHAAISGVRAVLCPSSDGLSCADDPDWSRGWLVFLDANASRDIEGGEAVLKVQAALAGKVHLRSTAGRTRIVFQGNGGNAGSNVSFTLCDGRGPGKARALIMSNSGGLRDGTATADNLLATCPR